MKTYTQHKITKSLVIIFLLSTSICAEAAYQFYYYVQLKDKNNSPYSFENPSEYLSQRAIARRADFKIPIDSADLPINPAYIAQIQNLGVAIHSKSKWMNGVTIVVPDTFKLAQIRAFPFVEFVEFTGENDGPMLSKKQNVKKQETTEYGIAEPQISQLNGQFLHDLGYRGEGIQIAVLDGGFTNVNTNPAFDSLRLQGRLLGVKDVVNPNSDFYTTDAHGAMVLSVMTGELPGQYLGTAPDASYWLIRTEHSPTEYKMETDFWCSGIEFADSVGVDVVNSSLGYYTFWDSTMNFTYADMNGKVSRASRAASIAAKKGIIVVVSAGNEGDKEWHYIGSPADAEGIISVGSVTANGEPSTFTSSGPSYDGRVKPEVSATGTSTALINVNGGLTNGNGTSFASPVIAGMMACLLQLYKENETNPSLDALFESVFKSGNHYADPTNLMGYGIPDFVIAEQYLPVPITRTIPEIDSNDLFIVSYNSDYNSLLIKFTKKDSLLDANVRIIDIAGRVLYNKRNVKDDFYLNTNRLSGGIYVINVINGGRSRSKKIFFK